MIYIYQRGAAGFEWDACNVGHIARHGLQPLEVEQSLANDPSTIRSVVAGTDEERWFTVGPNDAGRLLAVVWTIRGSRVRVVTAYPAGTRLQRDYAKAKGGDGRAARLAHPPVRR
jgi:uncharacterized DUF497 family protein